MVYSVHFKRKYLSAVAQTLCVSVLISSQSMAEGNPISFKEVQSYLQKYCSDCHGTTKPEGNLSVEKDLVETWTRLEHREKWNEVVHVLVNQQMPPEDAIQPSQSETSEIIDWITSRAVASRLNERKRETPVRRCASNRPRGPHQNARGPLRNHGRSSCARPSASP